MNVVKRLFKIQNLNASTIRTVMVADCSRFDSPELLLDAGAPGADPGRVFDLSSDSEEPAVDPGPARTKGLRRLLEGRAQPQPSECALETKAAELLAQGHTKPPEHGSAAAGSKLLIFTTGCFTYSPHQIGEGPGGGLPRAGWGQSVRRVPSSVGPGGEHLCSPPGCTFRSGGTGPAAPRASGRSQAPRRCPPGPHRHQADPAAPDDHGGARAGRGPGL